MTPATDWHVRRPEDCGRARPTYGANARDVVDSLGPGWPAVAAIAAAQHGAISAAQLRAAGIKRTTIDSQIRRSRLHQVHRGVYLVGHRSLTDDARAMSALLASGDQATMSFAAALRVYRLISQMPRVIDVSIRAGHRRSRPGIRAHRALTLEAIDRCVVEGIRVTSPARTLLDLASLGDEGQTERMLNEARAYKLIRPGQLEELRARSAGCQGWGLLSGLLDTERGPGFSRSEAELRLWRLIVAAGLPQPERNARVVGYEVDMWWRDRGLVVEVDGYAYHSSRAAFERDRATRADLQAAGLTVLAFSWRQIAQRSEWVVARVSGALVQTVDPEPQALGLERPPGT